MEKNIKEQQERLRQIILDFPKQFSFDAKPTIKIDFPDKFEKVIICGMGGSAQPGDLLRTWLNKIKFDLRIELHRDYYLPADADKKSLVICVSYSGNTEETISSLEKALKNGLSVVGMGSGGKLEEVCKENDAPFIKVPAGLMPRKASGYQFVGLIKILSDLNLIPEKLVLEVRRLSQEIKPNDFEKEAKKIAEGLINKYPVIYSSHSNLILARIFKIFFNEDAKIPSFFNYFPELNHNEMAGFSLPQKDFKVIILRDEKDSPRILERMKITSNLIKERGVDVDFIEMKEKGELTKLFSNIILFNWVAYYLALEKDIDPLSIEIVEELKKELH